MINTGANIGKRSRVSPVLAALSALALCACVDMPDSGNPRLPVSGQTIMTTAPIIMPETQTQSAKSLAQAAYYTKVQNDLQANDLLRTAKGSPDAPFGARQLAANFDAIALMQEYTNIGGQFVAQATPTTLHRWEIPVRLGLEFGASVDDGTRREDSATLARLAGQLSRATGHPVSVSSTPNFHVLVLNEDERRNVGARLAQLIPGISNATIRYAENMPQSSYCLVVASDPRDDGAYRKAVAIIRAENPDLLRKTCLNEEIAQGLGLANDSPRARPSIFNDDQEFAYLTYHDEFLLRILYDKRLKPGMSPAVARPIATAIAYELMP